MRILEANTVHIHYGGTAAPDAPALVFINPLGTDYRVWHAVVERLSSGRRILLYDKRGHGLSGVVAGATTMRDHAKDLAALLDGLGVGKVVICGLSVGGMIAQEMAVTFPDRVQALILCGTAARIGTPGLWDARIRKIEQDSIESLADEIMERWFSETFRAQRAAEVSGWRAMLTRTPVAGYLATCAALRDADLRDAARTIAVPTLCIAGTNDLSTPPDVVDGLARIIRGAEFFVIDGPGHLFCVEEPGELVRLIEGFLEEHEL